MPTSSAPASPGPDVTAIASRSSNPTPDSAIAARTTGTMARRCSRLASSGTTPPYRACVAICEATTDESVRAPRSTTAAAVSSHELSMPRIRPGDITSSLPVLASQHWWRTRIESMPALSRQFEAALRIVEALRAAGHQALFAGGCVRDLLLGRDPVDYDVATSATPDIVLDLFPRTFAVGAHFGVVLVADETPPLEDAPDSGPRYSVTEVATFRSDAAYSDGRHPDAVRYTTSPEEDV